MTVKLLTDDNFEFLSLKGGFTGSSGSTLVKIPHCWKSHVAAQIFPLMYAGTSRLGLSSLVNIHVILIYIVSCEIGAYWIGNQRNVWRAGKSTLVSQHIHCSHTQYTTTDARSENKH